MSTEKELRKNVATWGDQYLGIKEGSAEHKAILKIFNDSKLCKRYTMTVNDAWCQTFASAAGIACGLSDIIPVECGCERAISLWKNLGRWKEDDAYIPDQGDYIYYDWADSGSGDNTGGADHVGIVYSVSGSKITVIEGNYSDTVKKRTLSVNGRYIRGFGLPDYASKATSAAATKQTTTLKRSKSSGSDPATIWNYLLGKIGNAYGVAGLMGNLNAESGLKPINLQNSYESKLGYTDDTYTDAVDNGSYANFIKDSAGYGLAQWTYWSRKQGLIEYAKSVSSSVGNLTTQLEYLYKELSANYKTVLSGLKSAKSVREASDLVLTKFEAPADQGTSVQEKRAGYGQTYYDKYAGSGSSTTQETTTAKTSTQTETIKTLQYAAKKENVSGKYRVTTGLNLRYGASAEKLSNGKDKYGVITVLPKGAIVSYYGYYTMNGSTKWYYIAYGGKTGFVSGNYLEKR